MDTSGLDPSFAEHTFAFAASSLSAALEDPGPLPSVMGVARGRGRLRWNEAVRSLCHCCLCFPQGSESLQGALDQVQNMKEQCDKLQKAMDRIMSSSADVQVRGEGAGPKAGSLGEQGRAKA